MKRILLGLGVSVTLLLAACGDAPAPGSAHSGDPTPTDGSRRLDVYETLIRHLANPAGPKPIYVLSDLCFNLMKDEPSCSDRLSHEEQEELGTRLKDLGDVVFRRDDEPGPSPDKLFQEIVLGPIVDKPDGLRVEGGTICGSTCGSGAVYILEAIHDGYAVTGTDDTYGTWVA